MRPPSIPFESIMKKAHQFAPVHTSKYLFSLLSAAILLQGGLIARAADATNVISDAEIRDVITRVAKHQVHALADGDYAAVKSVEEAKAAKAPDGIAWSYPWGVTLFGDAALNRCDRRQGNG